MYQSRLWGAVIFLALAPVLLYSADPLATSPGSGPAPSGPPSMLLAQAPANPPTAPATPPAQQPTDQAGTNPGGDVAQAPQSQAGGAGSLTAPNMMGDLLYGFRNLSFGIGQAGAALTTGLGATSLSNPSVAEDNSPIPRDRVYYRYNHYDRALSVTGIGEPRTIPGLPGLFSTPSETHFYDVEEHTFGFEKTFFDGIMSVEVRLPFRQTVSSDLNLQYGAITGVHTIGPFQFFGVTPTPGNTLGRTDTELGNMTAIFKTQLYQSSNLFFSGGLAVEIPTGQDENVRVTDFVELFANEVFFNLESIQRVRDFHIKNDVVGLDPFLAFLATPTQKWFVQGFWQFDLPVTKSEITYSENLILAPGVPIRVPPVTGAPSGLPFTVTRSIADQYLMHANLGTGYWLLQDPEARWLTGIIPTLEAHYTTTLNNADIVNLPTDLVVKRQILQPGPQVGNLNNRMDILDLTAGSTFVLGDRATLALGFAFPVNKGRDDRVFDYEATVQLNYFFGARGLTRAPNLLGGQ